jgi:hypothetical protein
MYFCFCLHERRSYQRRWYRGKKYEPSYRLPAYLSFSTLPQENLPQEKPASRDTTIKSGNILLHLQRELSLPNTPRILTWSHTTTPQSGHICERTPLSSIYLSARDSRYSIARASPAHTAQHSTANLSQPSQPSQPSHLRPHREGLDHKITTLACVDWEGGGGTRCIHTRHAAARIPLPACLPHRTVESRDGADARDGVGGMRGRSARRSTATLGRTRWTAEVSAPISPHPSIAPDSRGRKKGVSSPDRVRVEIRSAASSCMGRAPAIRTVS